MWSDRQVVPDGSRCYIPIFDGLVSCILPRVLSRVLCSVVVMVMAKMMVIGMVMVQSNGIDMLWSKL